MLEQIEDIQVNDINKAVILLLHDKAVNDKLHEYFMNRISELEERVRTLEGIQNDKC